MVDFNITSGNAPPVHLDCTSFCNEYLIPILKGNLRLALSLILALTVFLLVIRLNHINKQKLTFLPLVEWAQLIMLTSVTAGSLYLLILTGGIQ